MFKVLILALLANDPGYVMHPSLKSGGTVTGNMCFDDDIQAQFGATCGDYWFAYDTTAVSGLELYTTDSDGGGTDAILLQINDGTDDICIPLDNAQLQFGASCGTDGDITWDGDSLNFGGAAEFGSTVSVTSDLTCVANLVLGEGDEIRFGTGPQYWINEDTNALHFTSTDCNGAGADCNWMSVASGTDDATMTGNLAVTGNVDATAGVDINADSQYLTLGAAGLADCYMGFDGTDMRIYCPGATNGIKVHAPLILGSIEGPADGGSWSVIDMQVSATPAQGTEESYVFSLDATNIMKVYGEADSSGAIEDAHVVQYYSPVMNPSTDESVSDDGNFDCNEGLNRVVGADADALLDTSPSVNDGDLDGQLCYIQGTADANTVTIADNTNVQLAGGANFTMGKGDMLVLIWDAGDGDWYEVSRSDN